MSASLRRSLGPFRRRLNDVITNKPDLTVDFDSNEARDNHLRNLNIYKEKLISVGSRFIELYKKLLEEDYENEEAQRANEELAESDAEIVGNYDEISAEINAAINEINQQRTDVRKVANRQEVAPATTQPVSIKLPKLELIKFNGNVMKWQEFWDSFESAVHNNPSIQPIEKMNYLKGQLTGEAKRAVLGLAATNDNYNVAITTLKERFGKVQTVIDAHYSALAELQSAVNQTSKLRSVFDYIELHLNSLEALGENVEHRHFVSLIRSKLPSEVIFRLEETKEMETWDVKSLRERLHRYLAAREISENNVSLAKSKETFDSKPSKSKSNGSVRSTTGALLTNEKDKPPRNCAFCDKGHWSDQCRTYATVDSRKQKIKGNCFGCLKAGHNIRNCKTVKNCFYCKVAKNHHSSLCPKKFISINSEATTIAAETVTATSSSTESSLLASDESVLLQTAMTIVKSTEQPKEKSVRLLLDTGSHRSYISEKLVKELKLKTRAKSRLSIFTFGSLPPKEIETAVVNLKIKLLDGTDFELLANVVPTITGGIFRMPIKSNTFGPLYQNLPLADSIPTTKENLSIDLLIGNDYYCDIITADKIEISKGLYLIGSKLGWIISGRHKTNESIAASSTVLCVQMASCKTPTLDFLPADTQILERFDMQSLWDLESIGIKDRINDIGDEEALQRFNRTIQYQDNRYYVTWPWKQEDDDLPSNFKLSLSRLNSLLRRYKGQPEIFDQYQAVIDSQLEKGIIETVDDTVNSNSRKHYIPHHAVITPDKATTKLRIVYDGSAKSKRENKSINECLYRGPVLLEDLCSLLIRFRLNKIGIVADIEKAFLQVGLQNRDRDVTRFLWLKDTKRLSTENNLQIYRFTRVPFGIISSPFLLSATLAYHLKTEGTETSSNILKNIYVDNIITGVDSEKNAVSFFEETTAIFKRISMNIREWASNSYKFANYLPESHRATNKVIKVLGYSWNTESDELSVSCPTSLTPQTYTKRSILKYVASIFDPLGILSPTVLLAKRFLQKLWLEKFDWDDQLSELHISEWKSIILQVESVVSFSFPRFICPHKLQNVHYELHCFCDASQSAYGACIYLRIIECNLVTVHLLFAKSRLAPVKTLTLPRLELLAVQVGSQCMRFVTSSLPFTVSSKFIWTDSQCVLHWLESKKPLTVFVRNRVSKIKEDSNVTYRYVPTAENPADLVSRGKSATDLQSLQIWWNGPPWLITKENMWPTMEFLNKHDTTVAHTEISTESETIFLLPEVAQAEKLKSPLEIDQSRFSSFTKLLRVTALCLRFIDRMKGKQISSNNLTAEEINKSKFLWIKFVQQKHYLEEISAIKTNCRQPLKEQLRLWLDKEGLVRCGGRIENSGLPELAIWPILLPKNDHITTLVVENCHKKLFHAGVSHTLAQLRNEYWIPAGRSVVYKIIRSCKNCIKFDGGSYKLPTMPPLPESRVTSTTPFTTTGLDYLGPLFVKSKDSANPQKVWTCLFTCLSTRAVHLELVEDMSAEQFLLGLQRFVARRGKPSVIISDNAPQFKLVNSTIEKLWKNVITNKAISNYVSNENIKWKFIIERAPWMGGFYERLIRLVKQSLRKSIGKICLSFVQLETLIIEIEAVINSRPLAYVGSDFSSGFAITPAHFLSPNTKNGLPPSDKTELSDPEFLNVTTSKDRLIEIWKRGQRHLEQFWKLWRNDYLLNLRERFQSRVKQSNRRLTEAPKIGDVVLVYNDGPRGSWKLARISRLIRSSDNEIRSAEIITTNGSILTRSLRHLFPLECNDDSTLEINEKCTLKEPTKGERRSTRTAARQASIKIQKIFSNELSD